MHNKFSWIQPILLVVVLIASAAASEKRSTTFVGTSEQAFNAALLAAREYSHVHYASVPAGVILFTRSSWDCGLKISGSDGAVQIELRLSGIKKEPTAKDADSLSKEIFGLVQKKRAAALEQIVKSRGSIEEETSTTEIQFHHTSADAVFAAMKKVADQYGRIHSEDDAVRSLVFIAPPQFGAGLVLLPRVIDQENGDAKTVMTGFRATDGARIPVEIQISATEYFFSRVKTEVDRAN
jgi:hypothetical protein